MGNAQSDINKIGDKLNPEKNGFMEVLNTIKDLAKRADELPRLFDTVVKNGIIDLLNAFGDMLKKAIWDPIDRELIQPARKFFDDLTKYINCSIDKIQNFGGCFFWYMIYIIQESINLLILGFFSIVKSLISIDLLPYYRMFLNIYGQVSDIFNEYTGFELFIFPYSDDINRRCFVCETKNKKTTKLSGYIDEVKGKINNNKTYIKGKINDSKTYITDFTKDIIDDII